MLPFVVSGLLILYPLLNLLGWITGNGFLVRVFPDWPPLVPDASLLFIFCGVSLACSLSARYLAGFLLACIVFAFSGLIGAEYALGRDFTIDNWLLPVYPPYLAGFPGRFSPNATFCFILSSICLALMNRSRLLPKAAYLAGLLGSIVYALGAMAMLGYLFDVEVAYTWDGSLGMAFFPAVAFMFLGLAIVVSVWKTRVAVAGVPKARFIAICLAVGTVVGSVVFWKALMVQEEKQVRKMVSSELETLKKEIQSEMRIRLLAMDRMGQRWSYLGPFDRKHWEFEAGLNLGHFKGYQALACSDSGYIMRWVAPPEKAPKLEGLPVAFDTAAAAALRFAILTGNLSVSPPLDLPKDGRGFLAFRPLQYHGRFQGVLVGVFRFQDLFREIVPSELLKEYEVGIYQGGEPIFPKIDPFRGGDTRWMRSGTVDVGTERWVVKLRPGKALLEEQLSSLPNMVLLGGILIALLMAAALYYGQSSRQHAVRLLHMNRELEKNRENFSNIVEKNADGIIVAEMDGTVRFANPAAEALLGRPLANLVGSRFPLPLEAGRVAEMELDGPGLARPRVLEMSVTKTDWESRPAYLATLRDVSESVKTREALHHTEKKLRRLVDSNIVGVFVADWEGVMREANDSLLDTLGYQRQDLESGKMDWRTLTPPEFMPIVEKMETEMKLTGASKAYEKICMRKDGSRIWTIVSGVNLEGGEGIIVLLLDISDRKTAEEALRRNEEQLRQSQKMEAVGRLAGGVAHDFNNLLTAINGYSEILLQSMEQENPKRSAVEEIKKAGERAAALTMQLLAFSRKQVAVPKVLEANSVVSDMVSLMRRLIGENVELEVLLNPEAGRFKADAALVQQVILNLAINARDSMPSGGRLRVETGVVELQERLEVREAGVGFHLKAPSGRYVTISVRDSGSGMDDSVLSHLFEPFFSTKAKGKGTGLGLSTVYGVVKQFNGAIRVESSPGKGTAIIIHLPRVEADLKPEAPGAEAGSGRDHGRERILLAEDDEAVRRFTSTILKNKGYTVAAAIDGNEAISWFRDHRDEVDLLITDVVMPGMNGRELADLVRGMKPGIRVVFISGYTNDESFQKEVLDEGMAYQAKPFAPEDLLRTVRETLDAPTPAVHP
ncbi:MAG: putative Histidine kinase [Fibrobacteres bacterium]|nr:putative Histidine kinase [Fibrobacterota bacterium]